MINRLRFRFIRITMVAVLIVLTLIISAINFVNFSQNTQSLDAITQRLVETDVPMPNKPGPMGGQHFDFTGFNRGRRFPFQNEKELPYSTRFFSIRMDEEKNIVRVNLNQIASVTEDDLEIITADILKKGTDVGWYHNYRFRVSETGSGYLLIGLEATSTRSSMLYVLFVTLAVGVVSFILIFSIIALCSKRAIRPIVEAYDKQKQFITDASHELKTPLTVISANAEILSLSYGQNEWSDGITRQANTMRNLIGQMIQMAKMDENDTVLEIERFNLSDAIYDTAMSFEALAAHRALQLNIEIAPDINILGNEAAVRQVSAILMDNAIKYCDADGEVSAVLSSTGKRGGAMLTVTNSFAAIDTLDTEHLFDRFYRGNKARESSNSFGLGLSIAKSIMEQHKGTLDCRKKDGNQVQFIAAFKKQYNK